MASAKVIVGVKYNKGERIVVCIPDGVRINTSESAGFQTIEWEFHPSIPKEVDEVRITVLPQQPPTYPTTQPIPPGLLITSLGTIQKDNSSPDRLKPLRTIANPGTRGYFFYTIELLSEGRLWAASDPGGANDTPADPLPPWPPIYP
ncbi:MAG: hypothetical protein AB2L07_09470 [Thermoanaerobaculaceae bacterium]